MFQLRWSHPLRQSQLSDVVRAADVKTHSVGGFQTSSASQPTKAGQLGYTRTPTGSITEADPMAAVRYIQLQLAVDFGLRRPAAEAHLADLAVLADPLLANRDQKNTRTTSQLAEQSRRVGTDLSYA